MKSQNQALLEYLQAGNTITSREAYIELGITQLGRCLDDLEKAGHKIDRSEWTQVPTRHGDGTTKVKVYRLVRGGQQSMFGEPERGANQYSEMGA